MTLCVCVCAIHHVLIPRYKCWCIRWAACITVNSFKLFNICSNMCAYILDVSRNTTSYIFEDEKAFANEASNLEDLSSETTCHAGWHPRQTHIPECFLHADSIWSFIDSICLSEQEKTKPSKKKIKVTMLIIQQQRFRSWKYQQFIFYFLWLQKCWNIWTLKKAEWHHHLLLNFLSFLSFA